MSADNYIYISKGRKGYSVWAATASCVCHHKKHCLSCQKTSLMGKAKTLKEAFKIARKKEEWFEYGITNKLWCK